MHCNTRRPTTLIPLRSQNLVVKRVRLSTILAPRIEVVPSINRATTALRGADREPLSESRSTGNGRLVDTLRGVNVVSTAVGAESAFELGAAAGVVGAVVLHDVVLDQRVAEPAVEGEVGVAAWVELSGVGDRVVAAWRAVSMSDPFTGRSDR